MGFGPPAGQDRHGSQIILVARVLSDELAANPGLGDADADAFLVAPKSADDATIDAIAASFEKSPWGVRLSEFSAAQASQLAAKGADFIVFESMSTQASVLNVEDLGVIATIEASMGDEAIRALSELPLDAALFSPSLRELPLSFETAIDLQKVLGLLNKPLIVEAPDGIEQRDIELLRNIGVSGLILDLHTKDDIDRIATTQKAIDGLPRPKSGRTHGDALVPHVAAGPAASAPTPDEDDDEDDYDDF
jgi:hypothetical protein